jgi:hypothetical protein
MAALHRIADDLEQHDWYVRLVEETVAQVEAFAGRWAAFEELVATYGDRLDADDPAR